MPAILHRYLVAHKFNADINDSLVASNVCPDLVLYDAPYSNPFRTLIPLTPYYPCLFQIIIATSALHMSNASKGNLAASSINSTYGESEYSLVLKSFKFSSENHGDYALKAKHQALGLLNLAINNMRPEDLDGILATVLLFVQFEIMDSGQNLWKDHIRGAKALIGMVFRSESNSSEPMSTLRRCLVSNCLVYGKLQKTPQAAADSCLSRYEIFETTFTSSECEEPTDMVWNGAQSLLQDAEGNHCSSFPMPLLHLIQNAVRLSKSHDSSKDPAARIVREKQAYLLLESARSFDAHTWAADVQIRSSHPDLAARTHVAAAHQAATCIYLIRLFGISSPNLRVIQDTETLVLEIQNQLSNISPKDPFIAATAWPSFVAGAEANDSEIETWAQSQFQKIWTVQPWGLIKGALVVLRMLWARRRQYEHSKDAHSLVDIERDQNWVNYMMRMGID